MKQTTNKQKKKSNNKSKMHGSLYQKSILSVYPNLGIYDKKLASLDNVIYLKPFCTCLITTSQ